MGAWAQIETKTGLWNETLARYQPIPVVKLAADKFGLAAEKKQSPHSIHNIRLLPFQIFFIWTLREHAHFWQKHSENIAGAFCLMVGFFIFL